jgi:hypothetical protein
MYDFEKTVSWFSFLTKPDVWIRSAKPYVAAVGTTVARILSIQVDELGDMTVEVTAPVNRMGGKGGSMSVRSVSYQSCRMERRAVRRRQLGSECQSVLLLILLSRTVGSQSESEVQVMCAALPILQCKGGGCVGKTVNDVNGDM